MTNRVLRGNKREREREGEREGERERILCQKMYQCKVFNRFHDFGTLIILTNGNFRNVMVSKWLMLI
jgi:hypothetical protein